MSRKLSRRQFVALPPAATIRSAHHRALLRGAYAAGKLTLGFWDHWVARR